MWEGRDPFPLYSYHHGAPMDKRLSPQEKVNSILDAFLETLTPFHIPDMDDWCDENLYIPEDCTAQPGMWVTDRFPYWHFWMKAMTPHKTGTKELLFLKGSQIAYTTVIIAFCMYISKTYPSPIQVLLPTKTMADDFSKLKLAPMIKQDCVKDTFGDDVPKGYSKSIDKKAFVGGFLALGSLNDSNFIKMLSIRYQIVDEEDSANIVSKEDGSNLEIAAKRQNNYTDKLRIRGGTPKIKETSTEWRDYQKGTQRKFMLPCPFCNPEVDFTKTMFYLEHDLFKQEGEVVDDMYAKVYLNCPHCDGEIYEHHKSWMFERGEWFRFDQELNKMVYDPIHHEKETAWLPSYYSPLGFLSWREAFQDYNRYVRTKDTEYLTVYTNQIEGMPISLLENDGFDRTELSQRVATSTYGRDIEAPKGVLMITMGVDIQGDRIEAEVLGHGIDEEKWSIEYLVFRGDTKTLGGKEGADNNGNPTAWRKLAEHILGRRYKHESGCNMPIEYTFVDAGWRTDQTHTFCKMYEKHGVFPVVGRAGWNNGRFDAPQKRHQKYKTYLHKAYKDVLIKEIYEDLKVQDYGQRYQHFPNNPDVYNKKYFKGLTSEKLVTKRVSGKDKLQWETPEGLRNEPIDVRAYALVAAMASSVNLGVRATRKYPLATRFLTFWKEPKTETSKVIARTNEKQLGEQKKSVNFATKAPARKRKARQLSQGI